MSASVDDGLTPLMRACFHGDAAAAAAELHAGADPSGAESQFGTTPLMFAVMAGINYFTFI